MVSNVSISLLSHMPVGNFDCWLYIVWYSFVMRSLHLQPNTPYSRKKISNNVKLIFFQFFTLFFTIFLFQTSFFLKKISFEINKVSCASSRQLSAICVNISGLWAVQIYSFVKHPSSKNWSDHSSVCVRVCVCVHRPAHHLSPAAGS